jgi:two-component system sensor histidine kinase KdpD
VLLSRRRDPQKASRDRELRTAALLEFTRDAAAATEVDDVVAVVVSHLRSALGVEPTVRIPDDVPLDKPLEITVEPALSADLQRFVLAVAHQAGVAIGRLQLAATARDAALRVKAEELRSALLSTVSHDLRTPLAVITGMATALRDGNALTDPIDREAIDTIVEEAQRLSRILTNLLSITKVESGAAPRREWVPLEELAGTALHRLEAALAGHPVAVEIEPTALAHVDPILVEQLLINLLENAAKHTPPGTPIAVRASRDATGATLEVNDRGPGLPAVPPAQLFDRFFRGERTTAAGVGLGLAVCRGIAVAHGGQIEAAPHVGGGAVFRAHFPDDGLPADLADPDEPIEEAR